MAKFQIYTIDYCPYCVRAKQLLTSKGIPFEEINLQDRPDEMTALKERTGWRTFPQVFMDGHLLGGFTELAALDARGGIKA